MNVVMRTGSIVRRVVWPFLGLIPIWLVLIHSNWGLPSEVKVRSGESLASFAAPFLGNCLVPAAILPAEAGHEGNGPGESGQLLEDDRLVLAAPLHDHFRVTLERPIAPGDLEGSAVEGRGAGAARPKGATSRCRPFVDKLDTREVLTSIEAGRMSVSDVTAALVSLALTMSFGLSHALTRPIRQFAAAARQAGRSQARTRPFRWLDA